MKIHFEEDFDRDAFHRRRNASLSSAHAFTLLELLAIISIIALLASLLLPALASAKQQSQSTLCRNNLKQLQVAWLSYADSNKDELVPNKSRQIGLVQKNVAPSWVLGNAKTDHSATNLDAGLLYAGARGVYRCPADKSSVVSSGLKSPRLRSYSLCGWIGSDMSGKGWQWPTRDIVTLMKLSELQTLSPANLFTFIDEHQDSIDDGILAVCEPGLTGWMELPSDRHKRGCNVAFVDGHVDHWSWKAPKNFRDYEQPVANEFDKQDLKKLQAALPIRD